MPALFAAFVAVPAFLGGCKNQKSVSEMSDDEKVAVALDDSLSDDEKASQIAARHAVLDRVHQTQNGDEALRHAMDEARDLLTESSYQALEKSQNDWARGGRGKDINRLVADGVAAADAYAKSAFERADWISLHTSWALLVDFPGEIGGYYHTVDGRTLEIYEMPDSRLNLVLRVPQRPVFFTATGKYEKNSAILHAEDDTVPMMTLVRTAEGNVMLTATEELMGSKLAVAAPFVEGIFVRYAQGEIDVFAPGGVDDFAWRQP